LHVSLVRETGKYKVYDFVAEHNHLLHLEETIYIMRSHRKTSKVHAFEIDLACASRISPKATHALMNREAGGMANLGYTELDKKNYLQTRRQKNLIYGEVGSLLEYFQEQINKNPTFHDVVQLDIEEKVSNHSCISPKNVGNFFFSI
jgi:zinc finger SWIM domain-containing protein 3